MSAYRTLTRVIVIFASAWFVALGSGAVECLHNAQHAREDAMLAAAHQNSDSHAPQPVHDDSNCAMHARLHLPIVSLPPIVLLICVGLLVAFVTQLATPLVSVRIPARIDCRGPPAC